MTENQRMIKLFRDLFDGSPWLEVSMMGTLNQIDAQKAASKPNTATNSIWELVNHVISWREVVLDRIHGASKISPDHNYFFQVKDTSEAAWKETLQKFYISQQIWLGFLDEVSQEKLSEQYGDSGYSVYDLIFGIMQHDAYHLGQLSLLVKYNL